MQLRFGGNRNGERVQQGRYENTCISQFHRFLTFKKPREKSVSTCVLRSPLQDHLSSQIECNFNSNCSTRMLLSMNTIEKQVCFYFHFYLGKLHKILIFRLMNSCSHHTPIFQYNSYLSFLAKSYIATTRKTSIIYNLHHFLLQKYISFTLSVCNT